VRKNIPLKGFPILMSSIMTTSGYASSHEDLERCIHKELIEIRRLGRQEARLQSMFGFAMRAAAELPLSMHDVL
jgi:hypothetical protein